MAALRPAILALDVTKAEAKYTEDRDMILADIENSFRDRGGGEHFNALLKLQLLLCPLDYSADVAALCTRDGATDGAGVGAGRATVAASQTEWSAQAWDLKAVTEWLKQTQQVRANVCWDVFCAGQPSPIIH